MKPFTETGRVGRGIRLGGFHWDFLGPRMSGWNPDPNFWGRFRALVGGVAPGLTCSRFQTFTDPVLLHRRKERKPLAEPDGASTEEATSEEASPKAPLEEARQKIWRNLKMLPEMGKKVQRQLKSQLVAASSSSLWDPRPLVVTHGSGAGAGDSAWKNNVYVDPFVATSPSQPQAPRNRDEPSRKASRSTSWSETTSRVRDWNQAVVRALSSQASKPEPRGWKEPQDCLPEEYRSPPPFAPGYC